MHKHSSLAHYKPKSTVNKSVSQPALILKPSTLCNIGKLKCFPYRCAVKGVTDYRSVEKMTDS